MTVIDVADAVQAGQACDAIVDLPGPVYLRLRRGEIPVIFPTDHRLSLDHANVLTTGGDVALFAAGMMLAPSLTAAAVLASHGVGVSVVNVAVIKPLDEATVAAVAAACRVVLTAENHLVTGGLGSAVAEVLAEHGTATPLRRIGLRDTFAEGAGTVPYLFDKYGLSTQAVVDSAWRALGLAGTPPAAVTADAGPGEYSPV